MEKKNITNVLLNLGGYNIQTIKYPLKILQFIKIHLTKAVSCFNLVFKKVTETYLSVLKQNKKNLQVFGGGLINPNRGGLFW